MRMTQEAVLRIVVYGRQSVTAGRKAVGIDPDEVDEDSVEYAVYEGTCEEFLEEADELDGFAEKAPRAGEGRYLHRVAATLREAAE